MQQVQHGGEVLDLADAYSSLGLDDEARQARERAQRLEGGADGSPGNRRR